MIEDDSGFFIYIVFWTIADYLIDSGFVDTLPLIINFRALKRHYSEDFILEIIGKYYPRRRIDKIMS